MEMLKHSIPPLHFLCIDDDPSFVELVTYAAEPYKIIIQPSLSLKDARSKIAKTDYDAYIIDISLADGSGLDLITELQEKNLHQKPIAVLSGKIRDEKTFRKLKELNISYVLEKPISYDKIKKLLIALSQKPIDPPPILLTPIDEQSMKKSSYEDRIVETIDLLTTLVQSFQKTSHLTALTELKNAVHKVGENSIVYGYKAANGLCMKLEEEINKLLASQAPVIPASLPSLEGFIRNLKYYFQLESNGYHLTPKKKEISRLDLYIIDSNADFLELIQKESHKFSIETATDTNPKQAMERLALNEIQPRILISSQTFPKSDLTAFDIIKNALEAEIKPSFIGMILNENNLEIRLDATKHGVNLFFYRPLSVQFLFQTVMELLNIRDLSNVRILIIDDDPDITDFISEALNEIGLETRVLANISHILEVLDEYKPQILLLDVLLPKYSGIDLLKALRADPAYLHLIIVIISVLKDTDTRLQAYASNADEVLSKPLDKRILQQRILNLTKRLRSSDIRFDPIGFKSRQELIEKLQKKLNFPTPEKSQLCLFEIDPLSDCLLKKDATLCKHLLGTLTQVLETHEIPLVCYTYRDSIFAIIFAESNVDEAEVQIFNILTTVLRKNVHDILFNCSIVPVSRTFGGIYELLQVAEHNLNESKNKKLFPIRISVLHPAQAIKRKEIFIIDSDKDLSRLLKTAFEFHQCPVKTFVEGNAALHELSKRNKIDFPALIISERKLPDMDGIAILNKIRSTWGGEVPFYFLTVYASDKDISEGIRAGVTEYFSKPVNVEIFIQKSLKAIYNA